MLAIPLPGLGINYKGSGYSLRNSNRASVGVEFSNYSRYGMVIEKVFYQAGLFYSDSYLV